MRPVHFAQAALIAGFISVMWEELVSRSGTVFNDDTAYRFGFLFVAVLIVQALLRRRGRSEPPVEPDAPNAPNTREAAKDPSP